MEIKKNKDNIYISKGDLYSDTWNNISKHHLYKTFRKIIKHLESRGFTVDVTQYHKDNDWGSTTNKTARKDNDVVVLLELCSRIIEINFTDSKNVWDSEQSYWDRNDDRHTKLSYLQYKAIELEMIKIRKLFPNAEFEEEVKLEGSEFILNDKRESCHSRDISKLDELGLEGVVYQMSDYDFDRNSQDKNKKQINCGETKYFYDWDGKLKKGEVYHNINNMWWVLSGDKVRNKASFELFDFEGQPKKSKLSKEEKINKLEQVLRGFESKRDYDRCKTINKEILKLKSSENLYNVWSLKHGSWWCANNSGYTNDKRKAGTYLESNILENQGYYNDGKTNKAVLV